MRSGQTMGRSGRTGRRAARSAAWSCRSNRSGGIRNSEADLTRGACRVTGKRHAGGGRSGCVGERQPPRRRPFQLATFGRHPGSIAFTADSWRSEYVTDPPALRGRSAYPPVAGVVIVRTGRVQGGPRMTRYTRTVAGEMSPRGVKAKLPRMPCFTCTRNSWWMTDARVPSDRAIAVSSTSVAWAAAGAQASVSAGWAGGAEGGCERPAGGWQLSGWVCDVLP